MAEACSIGEQALEAGGDPTTIHAMLGMFQSQLGDFARAIEHLEPAHRARPGDVRIANNLASALAQENRYEEALKVVTEELVAGDPSLQLLRLRGFLAQTLEQFTTAADAYQRVVASDPNDWESWNNLGNARRSAGDFSGGVEALRRAVAINPNSAPVQLNLGTALTSAGEFDEAENQLRQMADAFPSDPKPLRELHRMYTLQARDEEALAAIEDAVERDPDDLELRLALAAHRLSIQKHSAAEAAYLEVVKRDSKNSLANLGLAVVFELTNRLDDLSNLIGQAEQRGVEPDALNFIRAFDHRRCRRFEQGLEALRQVPAELESARRAHLLGQLEDGAGHYDAAFAAFERMNDIQRADISQPEERAASYRRIIRQQFETVTAEWASSWKQVQLDERPSPIFLVGFPRSGTTLLDTFLMGHPSLEVLEEEPMLRHAHEQLTGFGSLATAPKGEIEAARGAYFEAAAKLTPLDPGKRLVDKNPLAMNALPLIRRLFPDAKIILALRHPCDVALSCFTTNFKLNDGMSNFLRLDSTAELYDLSFSYFERARQVFDPPVHTVGYESLVENQDRELRALFEFLELTWEERVLDHEATARGRGHIKTASYAQVVEPIYKRSAGRWQNYRRQLEPIIPTLLPWIEKFGYEI